MLQVQISMRFALQCETSSEVFDVKCTCKVNALGISQGSESNAMDVHCDSTWKAMEAEWNQLWMPKQCIGPPNRNQRFFIWNLMRTQGQCIGNPMWILGAWTRKSKCESTENGLTNESHVELRIRNVRIRATSSCACRPLVSKLIRKRCVSTPAKRRKHVRADLRTSLRWRRILKVTVEDQCARTCMWT